MARATLNMMLAQLNHFVFSHDDDVYCIVFFLCLLIDSGDGGWEKLDMPSHKNGVCICGWWVAAIRVGMPVCYPQYKTTTKCPTSLNTQYKFVWRFKYPPSLPSLTLRSR